MSAMNFANQPNSNADERFFGSVEFFNRLNLGYVNKNIPFKIFYGNFLLFKEYLNTHFEKENCTVLTESVNLTPACKNFIAVLKGIFKTVNINSVDTKGYIFVLGSEEFIIEKSAYLVTKELYAVPTAVNVSNLFDKTVTNVCSLICIEELLLSSTRKSMAIVYGDTVTEGLALLDYKYAVLTRNVKFDAEEYKAISLAFSYSLNCFKDNKTAINLFTSSIIFGTLKRNGITEFSAVDTATKTPLLFDGILKSEVKLQVFYKLVPLLKLYFEEYDINITPNPFDASLKISEDTFESELSLFCDFNLNIYKTATDTAIKTYASKYFIKDLNALYKLLPTIMRNYTYIYNAKKKLSDLDAKSVKTAIKYTAYSKTANLTNMLATSGFADLF